MAHRTEYRNKEEIKWRLTIKEMVMSGCMVNMKWSDDSAL